MTPNNAPGETKNLVKKITILLADDHSAVRQGLRVLLGKQADFEIVGEASNGLEALREVERLNPDVLIVDLAIPLFSGLEVSREITRQRQPTRVLLLSGRADQQSVVLGFKNRASGYFLKSSAIDELVKAIRRIHLGLRYLPPACSEADVDHSIDAIKTSDENGSNLLTRRERQILRLVAEGASNGEISSCLLISTRTVEVHLSNLVRKLSLRNSADLIRFALGSLPTNSEPDRQS